MESLTQPAAGARRARFARNSRKADDILKEETPRTTADDSRTAWRQRAGYTIVVVLMSLAPAGPELPMPHLFAHADKLVHAVLYAGYALVLLFTAPKAHASSRYTATLVFAYCVLFGALMEAAQGEFAALNRTCSAWDMLANAVGAAGGVAAYRGAPRIERVLAHWGRKDENA